MKNREEVKSCKTRKEQDQDRSEGHRQRRAHIAGITDEADLDEEARVIYERYTAYPPDHFLETTSKKCRRRREAFGDGDGWAFRLWASLEKPHAYTLHAGHLGLPPECADPANFYCHKNVDRWKAAIRASFASPLHWKLELAERIHVHITADRDAGPPHLPQGGELVKPIYDYEGWLFYIAKPAAQWTARNLALWLRAKRRGRLPRLSGTVGLQNRNRFHKQAAAAS